MDELAQTLSMLSFGVIGVICITGVLQNRSWLDMFTIGGKSLGSQPHLHSPRLNKHSITCRCRHPRRTPNRYYGHISSRGREDVQAKSNSQEITLGRIVGIRISHLFR